MSTEVTPESLRTHAEWLDAHCMPIEAAALRREANDLEREQRPLPTVPGWYPNIVVERGGESCTGALLAGEYWITPRRLSACYQHKEHDTGSTIRWAEQTGKTPGQTLCEAEGNGAEWHALSLATWEVYEQLAAAVLAAHGTPTLTDEERSVAYHDGWNAGHYAVKPASLTLTPVGEHPEPGTRGLLPVVLNGHQWLRPDGAYACTDMSPVARYILADPRPDGAHA